jgi:hypothetical protein
LNGNKQPSPIWATCSQLWQRLNKSYLHGVIKAFKNIVFLHLSLLCCMVLCLGNGTLYANNNVVLKSANALTKSDHTTFSATEFCPTAHAENVVSIAHPVQPSSIKSTVKKCSAGAKAIAQLFFTTFSQYSFYAQNGIARLQRTDIIFPFHYFW